MLDRLDEASAAQQRFLASVGHELRTPITIARGHVETLETLDPDDPDTLHETVGILLDEFTRMGRLVDDLMAIARTGMDDFVRPREVELVQWFEDLELLASGSVARCWLARTPRRSPRSSWTTSRPSRGATGSAR